MMQALFPSHEGVMYTRNCIIALVQADVHRVGRTGRARQASTTIN